MRCNNFATQLPNRLVTVTGKEALASFSVEYARIAREQLYLVPLPEMVKHVPWLLIPWQLNYHERGMTHHGRLGRAGFTYAIM